jgi:hypothetical protein
MSANSVRDGDDILYGDGGRDALYGFGGSGLLVGGGRTNYIFAGEFRMRMGRPGVATSKNPGLNIVSAGAGEDTSRSSTVAGTSSIAAAARTWCGSTRGLTWSSPIAS